MSRDGVLAEWIQRGLGYLYGIVGFEKGPMLPVSEGAAHCLTTARTDNDGLGILDTPEKYSNSCRASFQGFSEQHLPKTLLACGLRRCSTAMAEGSLQDRSSHSCFFVQEVALTTTHATSCAGWPGLLPETLHIHRFKLCHRLTRSYRLS